MQPIVWLALVVAAGSLGVLLVRRRSSDGGSSTTSMRVHAVTDKLAPLTPDKGLDRVSSAVMTAVVAAIRRGTVPGSVVVRLGPELHLATAAGDDTAVIGAVRGALRNVVPPLPEADHLPVEVRRDTSVRPAEAAISVGPRRSSGPTPMPKGNKPRDEEPAKPTQEPSAVARLVARTERVPSFDLRRGTNSIGRLGCDLELPEWTGADLLTSRKHAVIEVQGVDDLIELRDQHSAHQVFVNDVPVSVADLKDGDRVRLGKAEWVLSVSR
jgi:hypothetical protein